MANPSTPVPVDPVEPSERNLNDFRPARELYPTLDLTREPVDFALFQALPWT